MPLYLNGTDGVYGVNGTNATPANRGSDTNTGIVYGTDTVSVATNGTTAVTVDSSQNVGIGTASPAYKLDVSGGINSTISGKSAQLNAAGGSIYASFADGTKTWRIGNGIISAGLFSLYNATDAITAFSVDSSGNLLVGVTSTYSAVGVTTTHSFSSNTATTWAGAFQNKSSTTPCGVLVRYDTDPNGTGSSFLYCQGNATLRAEIRSNGGIANYSGNNVALSDERLKTNINNAGEYLDKICAIPVKTFKYKDQTDSGLNLGVIAQDVEAIAPELVDTDGFGEIPDDGVPLKAIYQTDLQYALMKCIQELSAKLDAAEARIAALEGAK